MTAFWFSDICSLSRLTNFNALSKLVEATEASAIQFFMMSFSASRLKGFPFFLFFLSFFDFLSWTKELKGDGEELGGALLD